MTSTAQLPKFKGKPRWYFVRCGDFKARVQNTCADRAVWSLLRKAFRTDQVDQLGTFIGISRQSFDDPEMLFTVVESFLVIDDEGRVSCPSKPPLSRPDPPELLIDGRTLRRGPRKPAKDKHVRYRQKCVAEGRCPRCGQHHDGPLVLCKTCRAKKNRYYKTVRPPKPPARDPAADPARKALIPVHIDLGNGWYYDPDSPSIEELRNREAVRAGCPTPAEIATRAAELRAPQVDESGVARPEVIFKRPRIDPEEVSAVTQRG